MTDNQFFKPRQAGSDITKVDLIVETMSPST